MVDCPLLAATASSLTLADYQVVPNERPTTVHQELSCVAGGARMPGPLRVTPDGAMGGRPAGKHRTRTQGTLAQAFGHLVLGNSALVHRYDDLAHGLAAGKARDCFSGFGERVPLRDHRLDRALGIELHQLGDVGGV